MSIEQSHAMTDPANLAAVLSEAQKRKGGWGMPGPDESPILTGDTRPIAYKHVARKPTMAIRRHMENQS